MADSRGCLGLPIDLGQLCRTVPALLDCRRSRRVRNIVAKGGQRVLARAASDVKSVRSIVLREEVLCRRQILIGALVSGRRIRRRFVARWQLWS